MKTANTATMTVKGQVVIPAPLRRRYRLKAGTRLRFLEEGDSIVVRPMSGDAIDRNMGILSSRGRIEEELVREHARDRTKERRRE